VSPAPFPIRTSFGIYRTHEILVIPLWLPRVKMSFWRRQHPYVPIRPPVNNKSSVFAVVGDVCG
jgi:hypothetical protein